MSSIVRRAASKLLKLIKRAADPAAEADRVLVYSKDDAGIAQLYARSDDGTVHQLTPTSLQTAYDGGRTIDGLAGPVEIGSAGADVERLGMLADPANAQINWVIIGPNQTFQMFNSNGRVIISAAAGAGGDGAVTVTAEGVALLESTTDEARVVGQDVEILSQGGGGFPGDINVDAVNDLNLFGNEVHAVADAGAEIHLEGRGRYIKHQHVEPTILTDGANVSIDADDSNVFTLQLDGVTAQLDNPSNPYVAGMSWVVYVTQGAGGGHLLTFDTQYSFGDASAPDLSGLAAGQVTVLAMTAVSATKIAVIANGVTTGF